jgi:asparagine synthase (glutamine-hydrolysing)
MCGLAGILLASPRACADDLTALAGAMGDALRHRGPDDHGTWVDAEAGIALAHRRLSIFDLSSQGHQPMTSANGRYTITYNGAIYNFAALREALRACGHQFSSRSDTEVLLAAVTEWGLEPALQRCNGMFAFALWDHREGCLWLARDRVGKKPLYYGWAGDALVFGSELKALWRHPAFTAGVNRDSLSLLLRLDYIPAPHTIHEGTFKLMPGHVLRIDAALVARGAAAHRPAREQHSYWDARARMLAALATPFTGTEQDAEDTLDALLRDAVAARMVGDVPVGVFLSGGTDSSSVAALMQQTQRTGPVRSYTIGVRASDFDEAPLARQVAKHLGTLHTELYVGDSEVIAEVPNLPAMFDEPFADASQVPSTLVCRLARADVTVALSGDGGDELFFGYGRYHRSLRNWRLLQRVPKPLRRLLARAAIHHGEASRVGGFAAVAAEMGARGIGDVYRNRISRWRSPDAVVLGAHEPETVFSLTDPLGGVGLPADAMMLADFQAYVPDDLLCKMDRTSMAVGLEARAPLLDWRVVEFVWSLPYSMKYREGTTKYLLKRVLRRYLPDEMVYRGKIGFGAPVTQSLRRDLRPWAEALLDERRLQREGYFDAAKVVGLWRAFQGGERKWHTHLWNVLMFQAWQEHWAANRVGGVGKR